MSDPLWLTQWPYGFCCPQCGPGAGLQTDQSGNHAPPTEINTHFLSSLSHWFFPHSCKPLCCSKASSEEMTDHIKRLAALTWGLTPACRTDRGRHFSIHQCRAIYLCFLEMLTAAGQHRLKKWFNTNWGLCMANTHSIHTPDTTNLNA